MAGFDVLCPTCGAPTDDGLCTTCSPPRSHAAGVQATRSSAHVDTSAGSRVAGRTDRYGVFEPEGGSSRFLRVATIVATTLTGVGVAILASVVAVVCLVSILAAVSALVIGHGGLALVCALNALVSGAVLVVLLAAARVLLKERRSEAATDQANPLGGPTPR